MPAYSLAGTPAASAKVGRKIDAAHGSVLDAGLHAGPVDDKGFSDSAFVYVALPSRNGAFEVTGLSFHSGADSPPLSEVNMTTV